MKKNILFSIILLSIISLPLSSQEGLTENKNKIEMTENTNKDKLVVVWTSGDKEVATKMVFMYTFNAKQNGWWDDITLLVWGPSAKLLSEDKELQDYVKDMLDIGVNVLACKGCSDQYEVSDDLEKIGITVKYTGVELTNFIKERHVVTF